MTKIKATVKSSKTPAKTANIDKNSNISNLSKIKVKLLKEAIKLSKKGLAVIPLHRPISETQCSCNKDCGSIGKHPRSHHGYMDATTDSKVINSWDQYKRLNLGIVTGDISKIFVFDIDRRTGGDKTLKELERKYGVLPNTWKVSTGDGVHYYFKLPSNVVIHKKTSLLPGIDIIGNGGYVVAPPSRHKTNIRYKWDEEKNPDKIDLNDAPNWLIELITSNGNKTNTTSEKNSSVATFQKQEWKSFFEEEIQEGFRNEKLTSLAGYLIHKRVDPYISLVLLQALNKFFVKPPLKTREVQSIVESIVTRENSTFN